MIYFTFPDRGSRPSAPAASQLNITYAPHQEWTIPGAGKPLFEDAGTNFSHHSAAKVDTHLADRGPLLLTSGTDDHVVPMKVTKEVVTVYSKAMAKTHFHVFKERGHSMPRWSIRKTVALSF
jgi:predicted esterase